jgi:hypothetical protein
VFVPQWEWTKTNAEPKHSVWFMLGENVFSRNPLLYLKLKTLSHLCSFLRHQWNGNKNKKTKTCFDKEKRKGD